jgi:hypothetical protein
VGTSLSLENVGIARVGDAEAADCVQAAACGSKVDVVCRGARMNMRARMCGEWRTEAEAERTAIVMVHPALGEHSVVFDLGFTERGTVIGDDNELGLARAERLESSLVPEGVFA